MESAVQMLQFVASKLTVDDLRLRLQTELQLGYVHQQLADVVESVTHFKAATDVAPKSELASLALYHALWELRRFQDAGGEMLRFVRLRDSDGYRELLSQGYGLDLPPELLEAVVEVRHLLQSSSSGKQPT